jgi:hypothetical protein
MHYDYDDLHSCLGAFSLRPRVPLPGTNVICGTYMYVVQVFVLRVQHTLSATGIDMHIHSEYVLYKIYPYSTLYAPWFAPRLTPRIVKPSSIVLIDVRAKTQLNLTNLDNAPRSYAQFHGCSTPCQCRH